MAVISSYPLLDRQICTGNFTFYKHGQANYTNFKSPPAVESMLWFKNHVWRVYVVTTLQHCRWSSRSLHVLHHTSENVHDLPNLLQLNFPSPISLHFGNLLRLLFIIAKKNHRVRSDLGKKEKRIKKIRNGLVESTNETGASNRLKVKWGWFPSIIALCIFVTGAN